MTPYQLYWLTRLDGLNSLFTAIAMIAVIGGPVLALMRYITADTSLCGDEEKEGKEFAGRLLWRSLTAGLVFGLLSVCTPTTKELVAIYGISYLTQNADAREIPAEALKVLNQKLKEMSKDEE